jgi:hypothetical protein
MDGFIEKKRSRCARLQIGRLRARLVSRPERARSSTWLYVVNVVLRYGNPDRYTVPIWLSVIAIALCLRCGYVDCGDDSLLSSVIAVPPGGQL